MAVFKATQNRSDSVGKFKATEKRSYDSALVYDWETRSRDAYNTLEKYRKRISSGEYLSSDDLAAYQKAMDSYVETSSNLRGISRVFGQSSADDDIAWADSVYQMRNDYKGISDYFSKFRNADEYAAAWRQSGYQKKVEGKSYDEIIAILGGMEDGEEKNWLKEYSESLMSADDYNARISQNKGELQTLESVLEEAKVIRDAMGMGGDESDEPLQGKLREVLGSYGSISALESRIEELKASIWKDERSIKYNFLEENADFDSQSKVAADGATAGFGIGFGTNWWGKGDPVYDYINNLDGTRQKSFSAAGGGGTPYSIYDLMEPEEIAKYNYLYNTDGDSEAKAYLDWLEYTLNQRRQGETQRNAALLAEQAPILSSVLSVPINLMSGMGALEVAGQNAVNRLKEGITGEYAGPVDYNRNTMSATVMSSTIRGTVAQNIADSTGTIRLDENKHPVLSRLLNGKSLGDVYQLGMSMADSTAVALLSPVIGTAGTALLGGSAASQGVLDAVANGANDQQALLMGALNGAFEMLFEKVSLDNLLKGDTRNVVKAFLQQGFVEGTEELNTTLANNIADILVMAEKSGYRKNIAAYMAQGLSEEEATKQALWDAAIQMGWDFIGGMVSGGIMGSASAPIMRNLQAKETYGGFQKELVGEALEIDQNNAFAQKMQGRLDAGKDLSGRQLNRIVNQNVAAITAQDMSTIQIAAETRLAELGETGDVSAIAAALTKQAAGEKLSRSEQQAISNSKYGQRVANELNPENIRSGEYSSEWAQKLDTNRINAEEYSRLVEAAQLPQETAETTGDQVATEMQNTAQAQQAEPVENPVATVRENRTADKMEAVAANDQQMTGKLTGKESLQVAEDGVTRQVSTGKAVKPQKIVSIEGGKAMIQTDSGAVAADDIEFGDGDTDLLWRGAVSFNGITPASANGVIRAYRSGAPVTTYLRGAAQEFRNGYYNIDSGGEYADKLTPAQREIIYELGQQASGENIAKAQAKATKAKKVAVSKKETTTSRQGKVHFDRNGRTFDAVRETALRIMEQLSAALGVEFYVFESYKNAAGELVYKDTNGNEVKAPNGYYDPKDGSIHIDLNAGADGKGTMLFTIAHELTHFIKQWSPAKFKVLANVLMKQYAGKNIFVNDLVDKQINKAQKNGRELSWEDAYEEVVADSMEAMLTEGNVVQFMAEVKQQDKTLWQKIFDWFKDLVADLKAVVEAYKGYKPDSQEGRMVAQMQETIEILERFYADALLDAGDNYQAAAGEQKNTTREGGVKHQARASEKDPNVLDPRTVTKNDVAQMLENVRDGKYQDKTYIPVRASTPGIVQERLFASDLPIIMPVSKVAQALAKDNGPIKGKNVRGHALSVEDLLNIIERMDSPDFIYSQADGRGVEVIQMGDNADSTVVIVEFDNNVNPAYMNGYEGGTYNVSVTMFDVDGGSVGLFMYGQEKGWHEVFNKQKEGDPAKKFPATRPFAVEQDTLNENVAQDADIVNNESAEAVGIDVDEKTESVAPSVMFSERTWTESDYVQERNKAAKEIAKAIGVSEKKAKDYIDSVNSIAKMIAEDRSRLDYFSSPGRSSFVGNVEYGGSFDFSTLCKKRRLLTGTFTAIQKALPNTALTANEILDIRNRMKDANLEVSCGLCYVEGSRANMGQFAKEFLKLYKQYYPDSWQPNMADVNTPDGIEWVRINHPEVYEQYEYFWNHYGTLREGDNNLFASQQKPKLYQLHTEYKGEVLEKFKDDDNVEEKNLNGGIRLQSFSDFEIVHLIDTMQIIMDMSRVGLAGQAYTKVPDFAWALGDTGLKINLSLIAKGVDADGKLIFDDVEGMPIDTAVKLRNRYSKNVGTILVAFNDEQLIAAMADDRVDFIIPFHRSQWKKSQYEAKGLPAKTKDYTYMQNEKYIKPRYHEYRGRMVKDKATNYMPNEYWDFSKSGKENAEYYLELCARNNKRPKFYKILQDNGGGSYSLKSDGSTNGYWKLLIDFKMYDNEGNGSPQMPVKPEFNMAEATRMLNAYSGGHSNFPVAQGIVDSFVKEYKDGHKGVKYSARDDRTYAEIEEERQELRQQEIRLEERKRIAANDPELLRAMDEVGDMFIEMRDLLPKRRNGTATQVELDRIEELKALRGERIQQVANLQESLGLNAISQEEAEIREKKELLRVASDAAWAREGAEKENKAIEKAGVPAAEYFRKKALKAFKTTTNFNEAGYMLPDGKLLNFSGGERNHRYRDHRDIGEIYEATQGAAALNRFLNDGNIRIMAESPGIDLAAGVEPTKEQYDALRRFINTNGVNDKQFFVDFSGTDGRRAGNYSYQGRVNADRVLNDIKHYYATGEIREQSSVSQFLYSERDPELEKVNRVLAKENTELKQDIAYLKELLKLQKQVTGGTKFTKTSVEAAAGQLMKYANAKGDKKELVGLLNGVYEYIAKGDELTWDGVKEAAQPAAVWLQGHMDTEEQPDSYGYDEELLSQDLLRQVYDSYWNVSTLYTVADKAQKEINRLKYEHSKRMSSLRDYHKEKVAQLKAEHREALQRVKQMERERSERKQQEISERYQESRKKSVENRQKTQMRQKIRRTIMDLDKLLNRGNKKLNVKEDMQDLVAQALKAADILFTDTYTGEDMVRSGIGTELTEQEAKYMAEAREILAEIENLPSGSYEAFQERQDAEARLKGKLAYRLSKLQDVFTRERTRLNKTKVSEVLGDLADAYASLENSEYNYVSGAFHENVHQYLLMLKGDVGGTTVKDMSLGQLEELHKAYTMVLTTVRNANKMFAENLKLTREQLGNRAIFEVKQAGGEHGLWRPGEDKTNAFFWNNQKPVYAFEHIGSSILKKLFENTRAGEDTWAQDMTQAREYYLEQKRKYKYDTWDLTKQYKFTSSSGIDFTLNLEQIMSLYAYSKREQAHDHLLKGGFVFDSNTEVQVNKMGIKVTYLNKTAKAHNVSMEILGQIVSELKHDQRAFVDEMQDYLSTTMGEKGNEVSMQLYGVDLFKEKHYFPLRSAGQYMERAKEADLKKEQGQISIVNSGFTKATTPKSSNPVVLSGFMDVWASHVNEMSMYHGFVLPMEDFRRVYNYSSPNMEDGQSISVNSVIQDAYGKEATDYIDQLYRDLNGGAVSDPRETPAKALMGKFKKAAVFASLSVVVQQPSAIGRAFAVVDPKYFIGAKVDSKRHKALWAEVKKYAPVAVIKEMGYFDTGMGKSAQDFIKSKEYNTIKEKAAALFTDENYRDELLSKGPALADEITWCAIWEAVKRETKAKNPSLGVTSEEFLTEAGKRFTEVVTKTQVYDSVLARSANMRSKGAFMSMWTAFMAEPTTTINMVEDALRKGKHGNKKHAARVMGAVLCSVILNSMLVSLVRAMWDDDEDETFLEKYSQSFATEILDGINPLTYYPFLKDIWSALQGFDIERADMSLITSLTGALTKLVQVYSRDTDNMSEEQLEAHGKNLADAWWNVVDYVTALTGIPVKNVRRDINGAVNLFKTVGDDLDSRDTTWGSLMDKTWDDVKNTIPVVGWLPDETAADKLYKAITTGDTAYQKRLASSYATEAALKSAIRKGLRNNDPRIHEAAQAKVDGNFDVYRKLLQQIQKEGKLASDDIVSAIKSEESSIRKAAKDTN